MMDTHESPAWPLTTYGLMVPPGGAELKGRSSSVLIAGTYVLSP